MLRDLRHGVRQLLRQPAFTAAAVLSLALGIGLNTTLFSIVNAVLLRDTSVTAPQQLVEIYSGLNKDYPQLTTSYPDYLDLRAEVSALAGVTASSYVRGILSTGEHGVLVTGEAVTANYFDVLGAHPSLGRGFRDEENASPGVAPVAVLSYGLWQGRFAGRPDDCRGDDQTIGIQLHHHRCRAARVHRHDTRHSHGVLGAGRHGRSARVLGRADAERHRQQPGEASRASSTAAVDGCSSRAGSPKADRSTKCARRPTRSLRDWRAEYPATNEGVTPSIVPVTSIRFHPMLDGYVRAASAGLLAAVGLVLLIACGNVANLLLARGAVRQRELAIRSAIGASRARLLRQLLTESLLLAIAGGSLGLLIAWWAGHALSGFGSTVFPMPIEFNFSIDRSVLAFAMTVSIATAVVFGLAPAWSSSRPELVPALKESTDVTSGRRISIGDVLVAGQLALSLVLLVSGALLGRGLLTAQNADIGYDPTHVSSLSFNLQMNGYDDQRATEFSERAFRALRALPGVTAVSLATRLPLSPEINMDGLLVPGHHSPDDKDGTPLDSVLVGPDYFEVVGVPIVSGRAFTEDDVARDRRIAIINETMARQYWPDGGALGGHFYIDGWTSEPVASRRHRARSQSAVDRRSAAPVHAPARRAVAAA